MPTRRVADQGSIDPHFSDSPNSAPSGRTLRSSTRLPEASLRTTQPRSRQGAAASRSSQAGSTETPPTFSSSTRAASKRKADPTLAAAPGSPAPALRTNATNDLQGSEDESLSDELDELSLHSSIAAMHITEQRAIAVPAGRVRSYAADAAAPASGSMEIDAAPSPLPPRSLDIEVLRRLSMRDKDNPELIDSRFALRRSDGTLDQTKCDPRCKYLGVTFDDDFKAMVKAWHAGESTQVLMELARSVKRNFVAMINNETPPSLDQYLATELEQTHCHSTRQWTNLNRGLKEGERPHGVTLCDYGKQNPWSEAIPCARIAVPPGADAKQAYTDIFGETAFDDYAVEVLVKPSEHDGSNAQEAQAQGEHWHAALYGCGIAQLFNGAEPGERFHIVFANAKVRISDPENGRHEDAVPMAIPVAQVPRNKQPLAWYGEGWFETRAHLFEEPQASGDDAAPFEIDAVINLHEVASGVEQVDETAMSSAEEPDDSHLRPFVDRLHNLPSGHNRRTMSNLARELKAAIPADGYRRDRNNPLRKKWAPVVRAHLVRTLDFMERLDRPAIAWLSEHDDPALNPDDRISRLLDAAALTGLPYRHNTSSDLWRLKPLMQHLLGFPVRISRADPLDPATLNLPLEGIAHADNFLEMIRLKATLEARIVPPNPRLEGRRREQAREMQQHVINPAARFLRWVGARSARDWAAGLLPAVQAARSEEDVYTLSRHLKGSGLHETTVIHCKPILRQLLDLPPMHATRITTTSPLSEHLDRLGGDDFDIEEWETNIAGFSELPDDEARASLMRVWTKLVDPITRAANRMDKRTRSKRMDVVKLSTRQAVALYKHWNEPQSLTGWIRQHDSGFDVEKTMDQRWVHLLGKLREELPSVDNRKVNHSKELIVALLEHIDSEKNEDEGGE